MPILPSSLHVPSQQQFNYRSISNELPTVTTTVTVLATRLSPLVARVSPPAFGFSGVPPRFRGRGVATTRFGCRGFFWRWSSDNNFALDKDAAAACPIPIDPVH